MDTGVCLKEEWIFEVKTLTLTLAKVHLLNAPVCANTYGMAFII